LSFQFLVIPNEVRNLANLRFLPPVEMTRKVYNFEIPVHVHRSGVSALLAASRRKLSLVDCISFEIMRNSGIKTIFTFDSHFEEQGFHCIP